MTKIKWIDTIDSTDEEYQVQAHKYTPNGKTSNEEGEYKVKKITTGNYENETYTIDYIDDRNGDYPSMSKQSEEIKFFSLFNCIVPWNSGETIKEGQIFKVFSSGGADIKCEKIVDLSDQLSSYDNNQIKDFLEKRDDFCPDGEMEWCKKLKFNFTLSFQFDDIKLSFVNYYLYGKMEGFSEKSYVMKQFPLSVTYSDSEGNIDPFSSGNFNKFIIDLTPLED